MKAALRIIAITVIATAALGFGGGTLPAAAYALEGPYWFADEHGTPCGKNSVSYPTGMVPCTMGVVTTSALNGHSGWRATNSLAANEWWAYDSNLSSVAFQYDTGSGASNVTVDAADLGGYNANGVITLGRTNYYYFLPNQMDYVDVYISTDSLISWCVDATMSCPTSTTQDLEHLMTHELGHAVGLAHPVKGPNSWAVMECLQTTGEGSLIQSDDLSGLHYLYSSGNWGSPGSSPC